MGIKATFSTADVSNMLTARAKMLEKAIIMRLSRLGDAAVNIARESPDYTDRTGNLRSSIGFVVVANGKVVASNFLTDTGTGIAGAKGVTAARSLAAEVSSRFSTGYARVVVAGMDYAYYVEATGRDVLSSAEHYVQAKLPMVLKQLASNLKSAV